MPQLVDERDLFRPKAFLWNRKSQFANHDRIRQLGELLTAHPERPVAVGGFQPFDNKVVRILADSDRLDPHARELARRLAEEALELSNKIQSLCAQHANAQKGVVRRAIEFITRANPVNWELSR